MTKQATILTDGELREEHRELVSMGLKAMKAALAYQGDNPKYLEQGKLGAVAVVSYYKGVSAIANEAEVKLSYLKMSDAAPSVVLDQGKAVGLLPMSIG